MRTIYKPSARILTITLIAVLMCAFGGAADGEAPTMDIEIDVMPGITGWERPDVSMLVMSHEHGNIIEIPQLVWANGEFETTDGLSINEQILEFVEGYRDYVGGHPRGITCKIQTVAYFIGSEAVIVMRKSFDPGRSGAETKAFHYNYVLEFENTEVPQEVGDHTLLLSLGEIEALVTESASAGGLKVEDCELAAYVRAHSSDLYFHDVTVKNAAGGLDVFSWVYRFEHFNYTDEAGKVMTGEEAFSLLKDRYPDLPPVF